MSRLVPIPVEYGDARIYVGPPGGPHRLLAYFPFKRIPRKRTPAEQRRLAKRIRYRWNLRKQVKANLLGAHFLRAVTSNGGWS